MYYSTAPTPPSFYDQAMDRQPAIQRSSSKPWFKLIAVCLVVSGLVGGLGWRLTSAQQVTDVPQTLGQSSAAATPRPTVSRTFGDLLKEKPSYAGWLAGVHDGTIMLVHPQNGSLNTLLQVANSWYGPISDLVWSTDHTKLAYLTLSTSDAAALTADAAGFARQAGMNSIPTPATFPFGRITILDVTTKQVHQSTVDVRNTPKSLVWLDESSLAAIGQTVVRFSLTDDQVTTLAGGGNTTNTEQLQSPLAWDAAAQTLYFTKVKQREDGQTVRLVEALQLKTNQLQDLQALRTGQFADLTASQGADIALSTDGSRMAQIGDQGISYTTLLDGAIHLLPYSDSRVWLQHSILSDIRWLAPDKIAFASMAEDGTKAWSVWYIPTNDMATLGRGSLAGSWDVASGRLAVVAADGQSIAILTPDWTDTAKSQMQTLPLQWSQLSW